MQTQDLAQQKKAGTVYLVGAGPGNADLLTIKALRLIESADVIVYDRLIADEITALFPPTAKTIYVGKATDKHTFRQEEINALLVQLASQCQIVVRLKGGDPLIFGRGGEELETLFTQQIPFEVVPGVTAANGCGAYAGIPLTHRDFTQAVTFVTGRAKDGAAIDYKTLAKSNHTLVFYMGLKAFPEISKELIRHGAKPHLPVAAIYSGTTQSQQIITGTLADLPEKAKALTSPVLLIIGEVISLSDKLTWFESSFK